MRPPRGPLGWIAAVAGGIVLLLLVTALIGHRDKKGETVSAASYAQSVCGSIGTWRGEMEAILREVRQPPSRGTLGAEEPQSQTPQGRTGLVREGLKRSVRATKTLVEGVDNAGIPDTAQGQAVGKQVSDWADSSIGHLEDAEKALDSEANTLEDAVGQYTDAVGAIRSVLTGGLETIAGTTRSDPELAAAFAGSGTCQELRKEQSST